MFCKSQRKQFIVYVHILIVSSDMNFYYNQSDQSTKQKSQEVLTINLC